MSEIFDLNADFIDSQRSIHLIARLLLNLLFTSFVVFGVYVRRYGKNHYVFTYMMFNIITFTLCFLLRQVPIELGFALGLFAVFGILRYRTEPIQTQDLTYLFVVIGIGILNAVVNSNISLGELLIVNFAITGLTALLELNPSTQNKSSYSINYDNMEILKNPDRTKLLEDLQDRTNLTISSIRIKQIDLLRDTAQLIIYCEEPSDKK